MPIVPARVHLLAWVYSSHLHIKALRESLRRKSCADIKDDRIVAVPAKRGVAATPHSLPGNRSVPPVHSLARACNTAPTTASRTCCTPSWLAGWLAGPDQSEMQRCRVRSDAAYLRWTRETIINLLATTVLTTSCGLLQTK